MKNYKLLTPGPLTTSSSVKQKMLFDHCTWDDDYKIITQNICNDLLELAHCDSSEYDVVLMQGSGTFGVESVLTSVVGNNEKLLICSNGAYGLRMCDIADHAKIPYIHYIEEFDKIPKVNQVQEYLTNNPDITHVAMVHSETTSGILNDISAISKLVKSQGKTFIADAMSSFGGMEIDVAKLNIDYLISSSNKCIQGVPGFCFIIARKQELKNIKGKARSLSLDLYDQWQTMKKDGKWRFTSPTHVVLAFAQALAELKQQGGIKTREQRYRTNNQILIEGMLAMGFTTYIEAQYQSPFITTFFYPAGKNIVFNHFYNYIKERGYAIYPGKLTAGETFRVGNIGEIYPEDMYKLLQIIKNYLEETA